MAKTGNSDPRYSPIPFGTGTTHQGTAKQKPGPSGTGDRGSTGRSARTAPSLGTAYRIHARAYSAIAAFSVATYGLIEFLTRK